MDEHTLNVEQLNNPKKCIKNSQVFTESFKCIASQKISYVSFGIPSLPQNRFFSCCLFGNEILILLQLLNTYPTRGYSVSRSTFVREYMQALSCRGYTLAKNRCNSFPCTARTSKQRSCNQRVGFLKWQRSRAFGLVKRSCHRLLLTFH